MPLRVVDASARRSPRDRTRVDSAPLLPASAAVAGVALVAALVTLGSGAWIAALILLGTTVGSATVALSLARRDPASRTARSALIAADRLRFARVAVAAWARAAGRLIRVRWHRRRLEAELRGRLAPLGDAVRRDDQTRVRDLETQARALELALERSEREASAAIGHAREEIERERGPAQATRSLPRLEGEGAGLEE